VTEEIREEITKFLECNENEKYKLLLSVGHSKGHAKGIVLAISAYIKKIENF
jgi:hypothetical protein